MIAASALLALLAATPATPPPPTTPEAAAAAFAKAEWKEAARQYEAIVTAAPSDTPPAQAVFRLGVARLRLGQPKEALPLLERAGKLGWAPPMVAFFTACGRAALGEKDAAFASLHAAITAGFGAPQMLANETLLAPLRADARWAEVEKAFDRSVHPCRYDPKYREFDFWLGTWDVRPNGAPESQPPSENVITLEHDGCVIQEHWKSPNSNGQSFNIWDASRGKWFQTWVDNTGGLHEYSGNLDAQGNLVYYGDLAPPPGQKDRVRTRMTFFKLGPDRVRQFCEQSTDGGKTWNVTYDLMYVRRKGTTG